MEKRSAVHAIQAESLVFESNFGGVAAIPNQKVADPAWHIAASSAFVLAWENSGSGETTSPPVHH